MIYTWRTLNYIHPLRARRMGSRTGVPGAEVVIQRNELQSHWQESFLVRLSPK